MIIIYYILSTHYNVRYCGKNLKYIFIISFKHFIDNTYYRHFMNVEIDNIYPGQRVLELEFESLSDSEYYILKIFLHTNAKHNLISGS